MGIVFLFALTISLIMFAFIGLFFYKEIKNTKEIERLKEEKFEKESQEALECKEEKIFKCLQK
ncbi:hypothetical protein DMB91_07170 [Campylobacter sp. MIT 97-5078]|uniref:hypothetical protein n=1 Tax=Campylobacter sp. MIT 97-5078 TaxID=1548153 RepID=UPI0005135153|nr:hypothetical protein [Campylobacter sp. MIT 97-5078]KGI53410.1 hypothetical protein LR59_13520 [Campylobacter sp. MIT 97-5078]TQR25577.1 hypothetical protein DMB91_07170 [Campylobacter sp. MIT 97-5078]